MHTAPSTNFTCTIFAVITWRVTGIEKYVRALPIHRIESSDPHRLQKQQKNSNKLIEELHTLPPVSQLLVPEYRPTLFPTLKKSILQNHGFKEF
jgi:hypothetical protein